MNERNRAHFIDSHGVYALKFMPSAVNPAKTEMIANNTNVLLTQKY